MAPRLLVLVAAAAVLAGCGGEERDRAARAPAAKAPVLTGAGISGSGRLVDIGGRKLSIECGLPRASAASATRRWPS